MKRILFFVFLCLLLSLSCSKKNSAPEQRTVEYFISNIKAEMNYSAITNTFGMPDDDKGSGIHIYVYKLNDSTAIWIGYTDHIMYVRHVDNNGQLIRTIL